MLSAFVPNIDTKVQIIAFHDVPRGAQTGRQKKNVYNAASLRTSAAWNTAQRRH